MNRSKQALIRSDNDHHLANSNKSLRIYFDTNQKPIEFGKKLIAISKMYSAVCKFIDINERHEPLQIVNIQSGSWLAEFTGNQIVIGFLAVTIPTCMTIIYRKYTGLSSLYKLKEQAEILQQFNKSLEGIKTDATQANIEKSGEKLAKLFVDLIKNETSIKVNGIEASNKQLTEDEIKQLQKYLDMHYAKLAERHRKRLFVEQRRISEDRKKSLPPPNKGLPESKSNKSI